MSYVVTYFDVRPESVAAGIALFKDYQAESRAAAGNIETTVVQEISRPNRCVVVETWKDEASFLSEENAAHVVDFRSSLRKIHNSPYDQRVHHEFAVGATKEPPSSDAVWVITHVDVPPPRREETEVLLKRMVEQSRRDPGCRRYDIFQQNAPRTNHFSVVAVWDSEREFALNAAAPHTREFREALGPMLGAPYDERLYKLLR